MQKVLLTVILALFVAIAAFGFKRALTPAGSAGRAVMIADGGENPPPPNN